MKVKNQMIISIDKEKPFDKLPHPFVKEHSVKWEQRDYTSA